MMVRDTSTVVSWCMSTDIGPLNHILTLHGSLLLSAQSNRMMIRTSIVGFVIKSCFEYHVAKQLFYE